MLEAMSRNWWALLIRGIAAIIFGIAILFTWPGLVISTMVLVFAAYVFVDGIFAIISGIQHRDQPRWWAMVLEGVIGILAGIAAFLFPGAAVLTLLYIIAFWAVVTGVLEIISAIQLRKEIDNEWWMILSGIGSIIFGVLLVLFPLSSIVTLLWLFGIIAIAFGVFTVILAFRVRGMGGSSSGSQTRATA
jgi:uncharacterized membrane protein HdeD (DUF308 family)